VAGIWNFWLTQDYEGNRTRIRKLVELMRQGAPGDGHTVSLAFGVPLADIQAALGRHARRIRESTTDRPALSTARLAQLVYRPATDFEQEIARGMILTTLQKRPPGVESRVMLLEEQHPDSPRPAEILAKLALLNADPTAADRHWLRAVEKNTTNSYAYLVSLRERLEGRTTQIDLRASLPAKLADELRHQADQCIALNPAEFEGHYWLAWIEALADAPQAERLAAVTECPARFVRPGIFIPLAIANLRLKRFAEARSLIEDYLRIFGKRIRNQAAADYLLNKALAGDRASRP